MKVYLLMISVLLWGCSSAQTTKTPSWNGKWYHVDPTQQALVRKQTGEIISCAAPAAGLYFCTTATDLSSFYAIYVLGCRQWDLEGVPNANAP
jgi:hypothetical protein